VITVGMVAIFSFLFAVLIFSRWPQVDASHDDRAEQFGARAMEVIPQNALVFAKSDRAIFALWYYHYALQQRKDIVVAATDMLHFIWYADTLRSTYPAVNWPEDFLWPETVTAANPLRPVCTVSYFDVEEISCK
jgi:hypothetical protein